MKTRIISGIIGLILLLAVVFAGGIYLDIGIFLIASIGIYELSRAFKNMKISLIDEVVYLFSLGMLWVSMTKDMGNAMFILFLAMAFVIVNMTLRDKISVMDASATIFSMIYVPFLIFHIAFMKDSDLIWLVFITAWATDTFAYFTGISFKKFFKVHKLSPKLSPKKTIEGSVGGMLGCIIASNLFIWYIGLNEYLEVTVLALICSILSQFGDLFASKIKRHIGIKDYGKIMPGHGGVLDRFDSILFTAPVVYYFTMYFMQ